MSEKTTGKKGRGRPALYQFDTERVMLTVPATHVQKIRLEAQLMLLAAMQEAAESQREAEK